MEIKSGKMVKSLELYFQSHNKSFISVLFFFFFRFGPTLLNLARRFAAHHE